jgi:uncharacterized protein involved in exopolysaccharide biosynthesis
VPQFTNSEPLLPTWSDITAQLYRQRRIFVVCFFLVILGFVVTGQFTHKYRAQMKLLVRRERVDPILTTGEASTPELQGLSVTEEEIKSEAELLKGDDFLTKVVTDAGLASKDDPIAQAKAVRKLQPKLDISAIDKTNLITVTYESSNPGQSLRVVQAIQHLYPEIQGGSQQTSPQIQFLQSEVLEQSKSLREVENDLTQFTNSTGVISAELQRDLALHEMNDLNREERDTSANRAELQARVQRLNMELKSVSPRMPTELKTLDNPLLMGQLLSTLLNLRLKKQELDAKYQADNPLVTDVNAQIQITADQIKQQQDPGSKNVEQSSNANPLYQGLETELQQSQAQLAGLDAKLPAVIAAEGQLNSNAMKYVAQDAEQQRLLRKVKDAQDQYRLYSDKLEQALVTQSLNKSGVLNVGVAEAPVYPPLPSNSRLATLLAALFAALVLGLGAAYLADIFDPTVRADREFVVAD